MKGVIEKSWYFAFAVTIKVQYFLAVFMVVVVDRVVVKKVFHAFLKQVNLGRSSVRLETEKAKKLWPGFCFILSYSLWSVLREAKK